MNLLIAIIGARYVDIDVRLSINTSTKRAIVDYGANREVEVLIEEIAIIAKGVYGQMGV